jgi:hypothetical protein
MEMTEIIKENLIYVVLIGVGLGLVLGLVPLILAVRKHKPKLGIVAMVSTIVAGVAAVLSIGIVLPLIVMAIFIWLIIRKPVGVVVDDNIPADTSDPSDSDPS